MNDNAQNAPIGKAQEQLFAPGTSSRAKYAALLPRVTDREELADLMSQMMAELSLLPAVRKADKGTLVVADGTSCRHQIADGTDRQAVHVAQVLDRALK